MDDRLIKTLFVFGIAVALLFGAVSYPFAQGLFHSGIGSRLGARLQQLKEKAANKDSSVHYDPETLKPGITRAQVHQAFGDPLAVKDDNGVSEEVYGFYPDGAKYLEPHLSAATVAAAVFTAGMSLAVRQARIAIQKQKVTLYQVRYDSNDMILAVKAIPPELFFSTPAPPQPSPTQ